MAKRKRLTPPDPVDLGTPDPLEARDKPLRSAPPIADLAGAASAVAALAEVSDAMQAARSEGRMVILADVEAVDASHLVRDRAQLDAQEMAALKHSLQARGQQTPIEVVEMRPGRYGLISGWRRLTALRELRDATGDARFGQVQCLVRSPETASAAYLAMVEENEIRAGLSFYERARISARSAEQGAYADARTAVRDLFAAASASKRSKIIAFLRLYDHLDGALHFAADIPEHLGLALAKALEEDRGFAVRLKDSLSQSDVATAAQERALLDQALARHRKKTGAAAVRKAGAGAKAQASGVTLQRQRGRIVLSGSGVTAALEADLRDWLSKRTQP